MDLEHIPLHLGLTGQVFYVADADGRFLEVLGAGEPITGLAESALLGTSPAVFALDQARVAEQRAGSGDRLQLDYRIERPDGSLAWVSDVATREGAGWRGVLSDRSQARLEEARRRALQRLQDQAQLASSLAHELNNPLAGVLNYAELARRQPNLDPRLTEPLDAIFSEGSRIRSLTQALRTLRPGRPEAEAEYPLEAEPLLSGLAAPVRRRLREHQVELVIEVEPQLPPVQGRGLLLQGALRALIDNARDALLERDEGRRLSLRAGPLEEDADIWISFYVEDNGPGIPAELAERVGRPFVSSRPGRAGVGLFLAAEWVAALGGRLVRVPTAEGTVQRVDLPLG